MLMARLYRVLLRQNDESHDPGSGERGNVRNNCLDHRFFDRAVANYTPLVGSGYTMDDEEVVIKAEE